MILAQRYSAALTLRITQTAILATALLAVAVAWAPKANAAITSAGDVVPVPPAGGGNLAGPLEIGDVDVGTMNITGGTMLTSTGFVVIGNTVTGLGIVTMNGFGSDWVMSTFGADMTVGNNGTGSISMSTLAFLSVNDDLFIAAQPDALGEISISGLGTILTVGDDGNIGQRGQAVVAISDGGRLETDQNIIGDEASGDGRVIVSDQFSLWRTTSTMVIADAGRALLQVFDGARVENTTGTVGNLAGSSGTVEVVGLGSIWDSSAFLTVGEAGNGTLIVADGGRVNSGGGAGTTVIGNQAASRGHVEVRGVDSLLSVGTLEVANAGTASLRILDAGRVKSLGAIVGDIAGARGDVLVDGTNASWDVTGELNIGNVLGGEGNVTVSNGGLVTASTLMRVRPLGRLMLDGGRIDIGGTVGLVNSGIVEGNGVIENIVVNGAKAQIRPIGPGPLVITSTLTNAGLVDVQSGELDVLGATTNNADIDARDGAILRFRSTGLTNIGGSQLAITSGIVDVFGAVTNNNTAEIAVGGTAVAVFHDAVTNNGTIFVQPGGEILMLEDLGFTPGAASLSVGLQAIDLTDPDTEPSDAFGQVQVGGAAALAGTLEVSLLGGYMPMAGDSFQILTAGGGRTGVFESELLPALSGGLDWDVQYNPNSVVLLVTSPELFGDYNANGVVDAADYVVWRKHNNSMTTLPNDSTPGQVNDADYTEWRAHFGQTAGAGATGSASADGAVPEPTSIMLLLIGAILFLRRVR